jgi:hypothetical protein
VNRCRISKFYSVVMAEDSMTTTMMDPMPRPASQAMSHAPVVPVIAVIPTVFSL